MFFVSLKSLMKVGLFLFAATALFQPKALAQSDLITKAQNLSWAEDQQWLRLVQYQKSLFGKYTSSAEPGRFFLSPNGKYNPQEELLATINALSDETIKVFSQDGQHEEPTACIFPARKKWLEKISGTKLPSPSCPRFERFLEILQPQSLTYVFSSYYLNNPASAFGHTFLRINKSPSARDGERYELSDYGVGYAAIQVSENPIVYSFLGLSGLMPGTFDINPYYYKVREYNDFDSRDLWEYDLQFSPEEVQMAVAYIWELIGAHFNYKYTSENCAYRILSIFEVARPDLDLISKLKSQVMPADTVATLYETPGFVTNIHYRPSVRAVFMDRYSRLNSDLQSKVLTFSETETSSVLLTGLSKDEQRQALDTAMDYLDYRYPTEMLNKTGRYSLKREIMSERASLGGQSEILKVPEPWGEAPHDAQGSRRMGVGSREQNNEKYYLLDIRLSLHDLLDPKWGYPPSAAVTMGLFNVSYNQDSKELALDNALLYEVVSLSSINDFNLSPSWRLKFSIERGFENNCLSHCRWTELSGGSGFTKTFFENLDISLWLRMTGLSSNDFQEDTWRMGAGPSLLIRWNQGPFAIMGESYYRYDYKGLQKEFRQNTLGINYSLNKSFSLRLQGEDTQGIQKLDGKLLWYY